MSMLDSALFQLAAYLRHSKSIRLYGRAVGQLLWTFLFSRRKLAQKNIMLALKLDPAAARRMAHESFLHNGQSFVESALIPDFGFDFPSLDVPDNERKLCLFQADRPVVAATAHLGAWELLAGLNGDVARAGRPTVVVVRRYRNPVLEAFSTAQRSSRGTKILGHRDAVFGVLRVLRQNGIAAFLVDHNTGSDESEFLPFLGREAAVNKGPALLAVRSRALIMPMFLVRNENRYVMEFDTPLDTCLLSGTIEEKTRAAALFYTQAVERAVRRHPEQWFWMHNRWKTRRP
ncbi:MAG: lysophospholipid acyltransferase family protein [Desulfovibrionaceae bacterium]|nr:lysophospholipid acyltransferase family protein [Desulfovibrionaceae bacterium]